MTNGVSTSKYLISLLQYNGLYTYFESLKKTIPVLRSLLFLWELIFAYHHLTNLQALDTLENATN